MKKYGIIPHSELESVHYTLVRTNPVYRQYLRQDWYEAEHEPSNAFLYGEASPASTTNIKQAGQAGQAANQTLTQVKSLLVDLQNRLNKHIDYKKPPKRNKGLKPIETG